MILICKVVKANINNTRVLEACKTVSLEIEQCWSFLKIHK